MRRRNIEERYLRQARKFRRSSTIQEKRILLSQTILIIKHASSEKFHNVRSISSSLDVINPTLAIDARKLAFGKRSCLAWVAPTWELMVRAFHFSKQDLVLDYNGMWKYTFFVHWDKKLTLRYFGLYHDYLQAQSRAYVHGSMQHFIFYTKNTL